MGVTGRVGAIASAVVALAIVSGCTGKGAAPVDTNPEPSAGMVAMSSNFAPVASADTTSPAENTRDWLRREWSVRQKQPLFGWYAISSLSQKPRAFRLVALVDYRQVEIDVDGYRATSQDVTVPANVRVEQLLRIDEPGSGRHELLTLLFADPSSKETEKDRWGYDDAGYIAQRMIVQSGKSRALIKLPELEAERISPNDSGLDGVALNQGRPPKTPMEKTTALDADPGEAIGLLAHLGNPDAMAKEVAVFGFVDFRQVPLDGADGRVFRLRVPPRSIATVPIRVRAPMAAGTHELVVLRAVDPLIRLAEGFRPQDDVAASMRVAIRVR